MTAASCLVVVDRSDHEGDVEFWFILGRDDADVLPALDFSCFLNRCRLVDPGTVLSAPCIACDRALPNKSTTSSAPWPR